RDHVSVVVALDLAREIITTKQAPSVIVAAVDSLLDHELVDHYLENDRLLTPINSNGFSVGEAGSAILVTSAGTKLTGELRVLGMSIGRERATIESDEPLRGEGLTQVIRSALRESNLTIQDTCYRITDLNGEHYKFKEMALALGRFVRRP